MKKIIFIVLVLSISLGWFIVVHADPTDRSIERILNDVWDESTHTLRIQ